MKVWVERLVSRRHWHVLLGIVVVGYILSLVTATLAGVRTALPWAFVAQIAAVLLPGGYLVAEGVAWIARRLDVRRASLVTGATALAVLLVMAPAAQAPVWVGFVLVPLALAHIIRYERSHIFPVVEFLVVLFFGFALVWNLSYLGTALVGAHPHDDSFRRFDLFVYGVAEYRSVFPLVRHPLALRMLQTGYLLFYLEVFVVAFLLERERLSFPFVVRFLGAHVVGAAFFMIYPVYGPYIIFPESIDPALQGTPAFAMMDMVVSEYRAVLEGGALSGAGYFVGLPSLHTAGALILQGSVRKHPPAFWLLLPVNVAMVLATFTLGFHYLLDVVGGFVLAASVWLLPLAFRMLMRPAAREPRARHSESVAAPTPSRFPEATD